eukprot:g8835.t1
MNSDRVLIAQGAESRLWETTFLQREVIIKERFRKEYRNEELDKKLTLARLKQESRGLIRCRKLGVLTPVLYFIDYHTSSIYLQKIKGTTVRDVLNNGLDSEKLEELCKKIGTSIAKLHDGSLNHGDLTTSNMMIQEDEALVFIDFGLSYFSQEMEDKAVDLYVLERAIMSAHAELSNAFQMILDAYQSATRNWSRVYPKYTEVRMRGRKRLMIG